MSSHPTGAATVVVARHVRPGREAEFERWLRQILRAVEKAPGHLDATARPPGTDDPEDWVVVYRFATTAQLDAWLASPTRRELIAASADLVDGAPREQRIVQPATGGVTLVSSARLRPDTEDAYRALHEAAVVAARRVGGLVRDEFLPAIPGAQEETVALLTFPDRAGLDRWLASPERDDVVAALDALAEGERTLNVVGGFAGWFGATDGREPRRWKQALVVLLALLPLALAVGALRDALLPDLHPVAGVALALAVNVAILTWLVMPPLTRALRRWLAR